MKNHKQDERTRERIQTVYRLYQSSVPLYLRGEIDLFVRGIKGTPYLIQIPPDSDLRN